MKTTTFLATMLICTLAGAQATQPSAADLYDSAAKAIVVDCPASSDLVYRDFPPYGPEWDRIAAAAWEKNAKARELAHQARAIDRATWPAGDNLPSLNSSRALANEICDAAIYQHFKGNDAAGLELLLDVFHMTRLQWQDVNDDNVRGLVAAGIEAMVAHRLCVISSDISLTTDPNDKSSAQVDTVRRLIQLMLDQPQRKITVGGEHFGGNITAADAQSRINETLLRVNAERTFAAMSLACQLFKFEKKRWPASLDELVPQYLPRVPIDPWGDGKQTFGYVLIKAGLPDDGDRPLVYSRSNSPDGLFYRIDQPTYGWYQGDGSKRRPAQQKNGGQFRDVTRWVPDAESLAGPTTRTLP